MNDYLERYRFDFIVLGFTLHAIGGILRTITNNNLPMIILGIIAWYYILKGFWSIKSYLGQNGFSTGYQLLFRFYLLQCVIMIIRGYLIDYRYQWMSIAGMFNFHFLDRYYLLPYLMPLVCYIPWQYYKFDKFCKYASWIGLISGIFLLLFFPTIMQASVRAMSGIEIAKIDSGVDFRFYTAFAFASLLAAYITPKVWLMNLVGLISMLLINMIAARRGSGLISAIILVESLYFWSKFKQQQIGLYAKIIVFIIIGCSIYFVLHSSLFDYLFQRGMEDSRSGVDKALLAQMDTLEQIIGKGLNGRYYYPIIARDYLQGWRYGSETGFYNIVLKGGYLMAFTYILLLVIPAYKGLFKSENFLCKAGGFFIFLSLFELYPFGWLEFSVKFLVIWMMVVLCMNSDIRSMDDDQIKQQFFQ